MPEPGDIQQIGRELFTMEFLYVPPGDGPGEKGFWIGKYDVNQRQYSDFVKFNPEWRWDAVLPSMADGDYLKLWNGGEPEYVDYPKPVVYVSFFAAEAFCAYAGVRLPKLEEWNRAASAGLGFERGSLDGPDVGNWTATLGKGDRRRLAGIDSDPDGYKRTVVSGQWGFRCAADE